MTTLYKHILPVILLGVSLTVFAQTPTPPVGVSASPMSICEGQSTNLSYSGGTGLYFRWYSSSCGVTLVGEGNALSVSPAVTTTYYGRWETDTEQSTCLTVTVTVNALPVAPTGVAATLTTLCSGTSTTLTYTGGSGDTFIWHTGACDGPSVGTGNSLVVTPTTTTTYYGQWQNGCGGSTCQTVTVNVNPLPVAPVSVSATQTGICSGASSTLSYSGGSGTTFVWRTGACDGPTLGTGNNLVVMPSTTTTYYGQWQNGCGSSTCMFVTITVSPSPVAPISVSATQTTLCSGTSTTLSYSGGSGDTFTWHTGNCDGPTIGTGNNLVVSPTTTTTYYGRWTNGCGNSACQYVTVNVNPLPEAPNSVAATYTSVCAGGTTTLSYSGGSGDTFYWHSGSCSGPVVGTGNYLDVIPSATTTYYGQWVNGCGASACQYVTVSVDPLPTAPTSVGASQTTVCYGSYTNLTYSGGSGATFAWYTGTCGGELVATGNNASVSPTVNTTYYGRWETGCGNSTCLTVTINVTPLPTPPLTVSASVSEICEGQSVTLSYSGGSGASFHWYANACGGVAVGTGNNLSVSPTLSTTYYGRWENSCDQSACLTVDVIVNHIPETPTSINATQTTICEGDAITLSHTGGSGTTFNYFLGSCNGPLLGTGDTWVDSPTTTTTYYGQWETACGASACQSVIVNVHHFPVLPTNVTATQTNICAGESTTLVYTGGEGDTFTWYTGACRGTFVGTGNNVVVSPTVTTTYYGHWETDCGSGACLTVTVYVSNYPTSATSVSALQTSICQGESTYLRYTGGTGDTFLWYTGSCEGTLVGSGNNMLVAPTVTTTYYGLWETECGHTACQSVTVTVVPYVLPPNTVTASKTGISEGESVTLSYSGGTGDTFNWYTNYCHGTLIGTGNDIVVSPTQTTTYYGSWENSCFQSDCDIVTISINQLPEPPTSVNASRTDICQGEGTALSYAGGSGETFLWYAGSCGGNLVGTGNYLTVYPSTTTTYYGLWETIHGQSVCESVTVNVKPYVNAPYSVSASKTSICDGESVTLTYAGGSGDTFKWYSNNCRGTLIGTGNNLEVTPTQTTYYYGAWSNSCYESDCEWVGITFSQLPIPPVSVNATSTQICQGESSNLIYSGGSGDVFQWYTGSCEGTMIGTGNFLPVYPAQTTTYYGLWQSDCGRTECDSVTIIVDSYVLPPLGVFASNAEICKEQSTIISYVGGEGDIFYWHLNSCNGPVVGTGNDLNVSPLETTTYYGQWTNDCYSSDCAYVTVVIGACATGIGDIPEGFDDLMIYPNPTSDMVYLKSSGNEFKDIEVSVVDMAGKLIYLENYDRFGSDVQYTVDLSNAPAGMYFLKVRNSDMIRYEKIMKR